MSLRTLASSFSLALVAACASSAAPPDNARPAAPTTSEASPTDPARTPAPLPAGDAAAPRRPTEAVCDAPDGGPACTEGRVACGPESCDTTTSVCCIGKDGSIGCASKDEGCGKAAAVTLGCEERADCEAGSVCCSSLDPVTRAPVLACAKTCGTRAIQMCRADSECGGGGCILHVCNDAVVGACSPIPDGSGCTRL